MGMPLVAEVGRDGGYFVMHNSVLPTVRFTDNEINALLSPSYHPLKITISYTNPYQTTAILKTYINVHHPDELAEITNWLLFLGGDIQVREIPKEVVEGLQERLDVLGNK